MRFPLYHFSSSTGEFLRESLALACQFSGKPLLASYSTLKKPPSVGGNEIAVFCRPGSGLEGGLWTPDLGSVDGEWQVLPDFRGVSYFLTGSLVEITQIGVTPPSGVSLYSRSEANIIADRLTDIKTELGGLDLKKVRALTEAVLTQEVSHLTSLEARCVELRAEYATLLSSV